MTGYPGILAKVIFLPRLTRFLRRTARANLTMERFKTQRSEDQNQDAKDSTNMPALELAISLNRADCGARAEQAIIRTVTPCGLLRAGGWYYYVIKYGNITMC